MKRLLPTVIDIIRKYETNNPNCLAKCIGVDVNYVNLCEFITFSKNVRYESRLHESRTF